jgi:hypothetical protein
MAFGAIAAAALPSLIQAGVGLYSARQARKGQERINERNIEFAREQMAWQRENYQNRHLWEVADLRRAGLNPILSAGTKPGSMGSPASVKLESEQALASQIRIQSAKLMAETALIREKINTEKTIQSEKQGTVNFMGVKVPVNRIKNALRADHSTNRANTSSASGRGIVLGDYIRGGNKWRTGIK